MKFIALSFVLLAGCTNHPTLWYVSSPEERARIDAAEREKAMAEAENYVAYIRGQCQAFGFTPDTQAFATCVMNTHQANVQALIAKRQIDTAAGAAILGYSQGLLQQGQPYMLPAPSQGFTCIRQGIYTTCR